MTPLCCNKLTIFIILLVCGEISCTCVHSYMTFCDDLSDLDNYNYVNWTDLVIGSSTGDVSQRREIGPDTFPLDQFDKLKTLIIINQINEIKPNTFSIDPDDSKLRDLQLYNNEIRRLRYNSFDAINLKRLSLKKNNIEYIHKEAFYNCEIEEFDLSENKLEMIEKDVFSEELLLNSTKEIVLKYNNLEIIEPRSFPSSLRVLNLDYNKLPYLAYEVFDNLYNLEELTLSHNKLKSLPNVTSLKEIKILDFSYNDIVAIRIKEFNDLTNLETLDLGNNKISNSVLFQSFQFPQRHPSLQISLVFNRLTHLVIGNDSFRDHIVLLYGNPWNCKCWETLEQFMVCNNVKRNKCDLKFFGNGQIPYCVSYSGNDCSKAYERNPNFTDADKEEFVNLVKPIESTIKCSLTPRRL